MFDLTISFVGSFWKQYFDSVKVLDLVSSRLADVPTKGTIGITIGEGERYDIDLDEFKGATISFLPSFEESRIEERNVGLAKLLGTSVLYKNRDKLNYPVVDSKAKHNIDLEVLEFATIEELTEFLKNKIGKDKKNVIIKPNFVTDHKYPETTDVVLLDSVQKALVDLGIKNARIFEGPSLFYDDSFLPSRIVNTLYEKDLVAVRTRDTTKVFYIPREVYNSDLIVNIANFKDHNQAKYSGSQKNLMGFLPSFERLKFHKEGLNKNIDLLSEMLSPEINIVDSRWRMTKAQMGKIGGVPKKFHSIYFSSNSRALDEKIISVIEKSD